MMVWILWKQNNFWQRNENLSCRNCWIDVSLVLNLTSGIFDCFSSTIYFETFLENNHMHLSISSMLGGHSVVTHYIYLVLPCMGTEPHILFHSSPCSPMRQALLYSTWCQWRERETGFLQRGETYIAEHSYHCIQKCRQLFTHVALKAFCSFCS